MTSAWDSLGVQVQREHVERAGEPFTRFTCVIKRAPAEEQPRSQTVTQRGAVELVRRERAKAPPVVGVEAKFTGGTTWTGPKK